MKQAIVFSGRNLGETFKLPCVKTIIKAEDDNPVLVMKPSKMLPSSPCVAFVGDIIEEKDDGKWNIVTTAKINPIYL